MATTRSPVVSPSEVSEFLKSLQYNPCSEHGVVITDLRPTNKIGILKEKPKISGNKLKQFFYNALPLRRDFLGVIHCEGKEWILSVYGKFNLNEAHLIAISLSEKFSIPIKISLKSEDGQLERFESDWFH